MGGWGDGGDKGDKGELMIFIRPLKIALLSVASCLGAFCLDEVKFLVGFL
ncbi:MAG: hypothetical protein F6K21_16195, partial [Symploca sp. SIO2D2]|nr:hypothetical protein [Symploca sp. SIO2D2]